MALSEKSNYAKHQALTPFIIPQEAYNLLLLEKSARQLTNRLVLNKDTGPARKLTYSDFLKSFSKTARLYEREIVSYDQIFDGYLVSAMRKRYGLDLSTFKGEKIIDVARHLADDSARPQRTDGKLERRKKTF